MISKFEKRYFCLLSSNILFAAILIGSIPPLSTVSTNSTTKGTTVTTNAATTATAPSSTTTTTSKAASSTPTVTVPVTSEASNVTCTPPTTCASFSGSSFIGGIILGSGLVILTAIVYKVWCSRKDNQYGTF